MRAVLEALPEAADGAAGRVGEVIEVAGLPGEQGGLVPPQASERARALREGEGAAGQDGELGVVLVCMSPRR